MGISTTAEYYNRLQPDKGRAMLEKVLQWDRETPSNYNMQWGKDASVCLSKDRWLAIFEQERHTFEASYGHGLPTSIPSQTGTPSKFSGPDGKESMDRLAAPAQAGDKEAQFELGKCYHLSFQCDPPAEDLQLQFDHQASPELAQQGLMAQHFRGLDLSPQYKQKAVFWLQKSADQNYMPALRNLP